MLHKILDPSKVRDLTSLLLDDRGNLKVVAADALAQTTVQERALFGVRHAFYGFLTLELVEHVRALIAGRSAIEIGAGHGGLARALGIPATDNLQQNDPAIRAHYELLKQPTIRYGENVLKMDAAQALHHFKPQVVVASWVTHRYDPRRHEAGGNQDGVREEDVIAACDAYIFLGNERVHAQKSIWKLPHKKVHPPWLFSRAANGSPDFLAVWERQ